MRHGRSPRLFLERRLYLERLESRIAALDRVTEQEASLSDLSIRDEALMAFAADSRPDWSEDGVPVSAELWDDPAFADPFAEPGTGSASALPPSASADGTGGTAPAPQAPLTAPASGGTQTASGGSGAGTANPASSPQSPAPQSSPTASPPAAPANPPASNPPPAPPPSASNGAYSTPHDQTLSVSADQGVLGSGSPPGVQAVLVSGPSHGTLALNGDGSFTYAPSAGFVGDDSFAFAATNGSSSSPPATVTLSVSNTAPVAQAATRSVFAAAPTSFDADHGVLAGAVDDEGDALTAQLVSGPSQGALALNPDGSFTYTPGTGFTGHDSFTIQASDGLLSSDPVTMNLVAGPVARDDAFTAQHDSTTTEEASYGLLANDEVAGGGTLTAVLVNGPAHGTLALRDDGSLDYAPTAGYVGPDSFSYAAQAGSQSSAPATVSIDVMNAGPPVAADTDYSVHAGTTLTVGGNGLADVASDPDPTDTLRFTLGTGPAHGTLALDPAGTFSYTPNAGYAGDDTFTYGVSDGAASGGTGTVTIHVTDNAPIASNASFDVTQGGLAPAPERSVLTCAAVDIDGDPLTASLAVGPAHAAAFAFNPDGTFLYTAQAGYEGTDTFQFQASDGTLLSGIGTVTLYVSANAIAHDDTYGLRPTPLVVPPAQGVLANDFIAYGQPGASGAGGGAGTRDGPAEPGRRVRLHATDRCASDRGRDVQVRDPDAGDAAAGSTAGRGCGHRSVGAIGLRRGEPARPDEPGHQGHHERSP